MSAHARLGPSNHRWPNCPGSIAAEAGYEDVAGAAAIDGTGSHLLLEMCMDNHVRAESYVGQIIGVNHHDMPNGWLIHQDRADRVNMCLDYIHRRVTELSDKYIGCTVSVEAESHADPGGAFGRTDWWGTVDITITVSDGTQVFFVEICDYKDGRGWVHVPGNTQLLSYAFGKIRPYVGSGPDTCSPFQAIGVRDGVRVGVVQPKTNPVIRYEDVTTHSVIEEAFKLYRAARATDDENAPRVAGKHCQWCKDNVKRGGSCNAETVQSLEVVNNMELITTDATPASGGDIFASITTFLTNVEVLESDQLSKLIEIYPGIQAGFARVSEEIEKRVKAGQVVPGWAMKPCKGSNIYAFSDEEIAKKLKAKRLKKDEIYPAKLISPAQLLKLSNLTDIQKKKIQEELIVHKAGSDKLTKVAIGEESEEMFKDVAEVVEQSSTSVVQSDSEAVEMFKDVVTSPAVISFI